MNRALFVRSVKSIAKLWLVFTAVLSMYIVMITMMYSPEMNESLNILVESMGGLMGMFGMHPGAITLSSFLVNYLYGMLLLIFPLVFCILASNKLMARRVDSGSMAYLLASPNGRVKVAVTQAAALLFGVLLMVVYCTALALISGAVMFPGDLEPGPWLGLNAGLLCLHICLAGFCFFASCLFNESRHAVALGAGVPVLCYLLQMLANMGEKFENLKYASVFTLFDPNGLLAGESGAITGAVVLLVLGVGFFTVGITAFNKRDLPL